MGIGVRLRRGSRRQERLDPVRWRWPRRGTVVRAAVVTTLLAVAAGLTVTDVGSSPCATSDAAHTSPATAASATRSPDADQRPHDHPPRQGPHGEPLPVPPGLVGVPVRLADAALVTVVRPGDRVDVFVTTARHTAQPLASNVLVLATTSDDVAGVLLVAATDAQARRLTAAPPEVRLGITVRPV